VIAWAAYAQRKYPELELLFHVPNGEARDPRTAAKLKWLGVRPGVPDLLLPMPRGPYAGLALEMKRRRGGPPGIRCAGTLLGASGGLRMACGGLRRGGGGDRGTAEVPGVATKDANGLTPKQARFVQEYLKDANGKQAAIRCGYRPSRAERTACELLSLRKISEAVAAGQDQLDEFAGLTRKRVIDGLLAEAEFRGEGSVASARVAAWGHLAKIRGMFTERHEHSGSVELHLTW
jgi:hypothetical protein